MTTPPQAPGTARRRSYPTASLAAQASLAQAFYSAQALLAAMAVRDIIALWQQLNLRDVRQSWPAIRTALAGLIETRFGMSASQAGAYYAQARQAAGVPGPAPRLSLPPVPFPVAAAAAGAPPVVTVPPPSPQLITATLDSTGPWALLGRIRKAQPLEQAMENTSVILSGAASRLIQNGARQTVISAVQADSEAIGWMRVIGTSRTGPCAFCSMLSSRGFAYKSEASALAYWHDHCKCTAQPVWSVKDAEAMRDNDLYRQWREVTRGYSKKDALNAWRRYWDKKTGRDGIRVLPAA